MYMYQGLGQMLTKCLQHHQGCPETPKSADVICEWPLTFEWCDQHYIKLINNQLIAGLRGVHPMNSSRYLCLFINPWTSAPPQMIRTLQMTKMSRVEPGAANLEIQWAKSGENGRRRQKTEKQICLKQRLLDSCHPCGSGAKCHAAFR